MIVNPATRAHGIKIEGMQKEWKKQMQKICRKQIARPPISVEGLWGYEEAECHK